MTPGPDPMGKRALFWMPVGEDEAGDVRTAGAGTFHPATGWHARPAGKHALFSAATPAGDDEDASGGPSNPVPRRGPLVVACSSCGSVSRVGLFELLLLQLPFGAWLPRGAFDRWMTCPSCRRRTWTSVTLSR